MASRWSLMMLLRPEGLFPSRRRRRELHSVDVTSVAALADPDGAAALEPQDLDLDAVDPDIKEDGQ
jgi:hypothetical protein